MIFMQLTLAQLRKLQMPYKCSEELDLSKELDGFEDILSSSKVAVEYEIRERGIDTYMVNFSFKVDLVMECSITLQEVPYTIEANASEIFSNQEEIEDAILIEGQTLDTKEAVLTNILIQKPMRVVTEGVDFEDDVEEETSTDGINPAFANLKDFL